MSTKPRDDAYLQLVSADRAAEIAKHEREALLARFRAADQKLYDNARRRNDGKHSNSDSQRI